MSRWACELLASLIAVAAHAQSPSAAVELAAKDVARVPAEARPFARYLVLPFEQDGKRLSQWDAVLRFWLNSLSRNADRALIVRVAPNLWRIDLREQTWDAKVWEKLADAEPHFLVRLVKVDAKVKTLIIDHKGGDCKHPVTGHTIKNLAPGKYSYEVSESAQGKAAFGPWIDAKAGLALATACQTQVPIVRLDWWLATAVIPNDKGTGYYDWLGLGKKEADFQGLGGVDVKKARALQKEIGALVSRSTVTLNNRALDRYQGITGAYWRSRDFAKNTDVKNALRLLDDDIKEDASEQYLTLPNGLFAFWLQNGDGVRADTAPDFIASDGKATGTDRRVHAGLSCVRCHVEGIRPIKDWARKVYQPPFTLDDKLYEEAKRKRAKYLSDLQEQVEEDQQRYAKALKKVNGLTPELNAKAVAEAWDAYAERDRSLADVALELGMEAEALTAALKAEAKRTTLDPVLAGLLQGEPCRAEHLEELVPLIYEILSRGNK